MFTALSVLPDLAKALTVGCFDLLLTTILDKRSWNTNQKMKTSAMQGKKKALVRKSKTCTGLRS